MGARTKSVRDGRPTGVYPLARHSVKRNSRVQGQSGHLTLTPLENTYAARRKAERALRVLAMDERVNIDATIHITLTATSAEARS